MLGHEFGEWKVRRAVGKLPGPAHSSASPHPTDDASFGTAFGHKAVGSVPGTGIGKAVRLANDLPDISVVLKRGTSKTVQSAPFTPSRFAGHRTSRHGTRAPPKEPVKPAVLRHVGNPHRIRFTNRVLMHTSENASPPRQEGAAEQVHASV